MMASMRFLFLVLVVAIAPVTPANPANRQSQPLYPDFVFHPFGEEENSEPIDVEDIIRTFDEDLATAIEEALAGRDEPEDEEEEPETSLPSISPAHPEMPRAQVLTFDT
ncbi:MAG: hypothetical protein JJU11_07050, partial [Candidatus Sumerlaeia bacterium]|nr:hypothetical protein [Candidatus Sumerlaeia bacterium]